MKHLRSHLYDAYKTISYCSVESILKLLEFPYLYQILFCMHTFICM